ncbi:DUF6193 family natural product biosynthesis protein [Kitasatospora sp. NPDC048540]|uniref:DUF6193 family natural product biosynthesis protein n=1 Tax=Kitasatospora sp. NPDC048540 TaxID=3155634 RepID=UPI00340FB78D
MTSSSLPLPTPPETATSLADALRRAAARLGLDLPAPEENWERRAEYGAAGDRRVIVRDLQDERGYWVHCRLRDAWLASGAAPDLDAVVRCAAAWSSGAGLEATRAAAPFIGFGEWALAHEREPLDPVELAWWHLIDSVRRSPFAWDRGPHALGRLALLEAAHARPELRRLRPVTSHYILWFSSSTELPYVRVGYSIEPLRDGRYLVRDRGEAVAHTGTPEEAVALAVASLPQGTGPAR